MSQFGPEGTKDAPISRSCDPANTELHNSGSGQPEPPCFAPARCRGGCRLRPTYPFGRPLKSGLDGEHAHGSRAKVMLGQGASGMLGLISAAILP
jgi:hypothetical protein